MPSLHSAFAMLVVAFFFTRVRRRFIPLLLLYPLAMTFTLVYAGEHYVVDVLVGWTYVLIATVVVGYAERRWRARREDRTAVGAEEEPLVEAAPDPAGRPSR
jgi:membrane-associated phospholipid phosphatase